jgi:predicted metalloendopeptidase
LYCDRAGEKRADLEIKPTSTAFKAKTDKLVALFNDYVVLDSLHVNGSLTLGENIADFGGMVISYDAYHMSLNGKEAPVIDGYSGDQRFFLGLAQVTRGKMREEAMRQRLMTDPHSPGQYRCNGILANLPAFYKAFDVKEGDGMYRAEDIRVDIW